jgi:pSer/pThr/pTyr-binding forkhead associated (FHA) protein
MKFVLRLGPREYDLPVGRFVIGRAELCELPLDDPLVSRQHVALVVGEHIVTVEDLGSRNGVKLNGSRLEGPARMTLGDRLAVGDSEFVLAVRKRDPGAETLVGAPTQRLPAFGLIGTLADKALALGRTDEAERLLGHQLEQLAAEAAEGRRCDPQAVERGSEYSLKLAVATGNPHWIDLVFRLHRALRRPCSAALVEELYAVSRKVRQPVLTEFRLYLQTLRELGGELGPADRFLVSRLEGLERSLG